MVGDLASQCLQALRPQQRKGTRILEDGRNQLGMPKAEN